MATATHPERVGRGAVATEHTGAAPRCGVLCPRESWDCEPARGWRSASETRISLLGVRQHTPPFDRKRVRRVFIPRPGAEASGEQAAFERILDRSTGGDLPPNCTKRGCCQFIPADQGSGAAYQTSAALCYKGAACRLDQLYQEEIPLCSSRVPRPVGPALLRRLSPASSSRFAQTACLKRRGARMPEFELPLSHCGEVPLSARSLGLVIFC